MHKRWTNMVVVLGLSVVLGTSVVAVGADGAALWDKNCASCHGKDGKGDTKAGKLTKVRDLTAPDLRAMLTADHVRETIAQGIVDKTTGKNRMKGYKDKFSPVEIDALTTYVQGLAGATK